MTQTIERREKLTLNWRPAGSPARRVDDFAEVPHLAVAPAPPARADHERRDIGSRLENWARVYRDTYRAGISPTAAFCDQLRREALGEAGSPERRKVDDADAERIERAMRILETKHRLMMYWCYIKQAHPGEVCRHLGLSQRPATVFTAAFRAAQLAVEQAAQPSNNFHDA